MESGVYRICLKNRYHVDQVTGVMVGASALQSVDLGSVTLNHTQHHRNDIHKPPAWRVTYETGFTLFNNIHKSLLGA